MSDETTGVTGDIASIVESLIGAGLAMADQQKINEGLSSSEAVKSMHETHIAFRQWASQYDNPTFSGRSQA